MEAVARRRAELKQEEASKADATVSTPRDSPSRSATWQMKPASHHLLTVALGCKAVLSRKRAPLSSAEVLVYQFSLF